VVSDDVGIARKVIRKEPLIAALPHRHPLLKKREAVKLRKLVGETVRHPVEPDEAEHRPRSFESLRLRVAAELEAEADVVDDPPVGQQPEVLEDHREAVPAEVAEPLRVRLADVLAVEADLAERRLDEPGEAPDERRLAAAREAHHDEDLARPDVERDVPDRRGPAVLLEGGVDGLRVRGGGAGPREARFGRAEDLPEVADRDGRLGAAGLAPGRGSAGLGFGRPSPGSGEVRLSDRGHGTLLLGDARRAGDGTPMRARVAPLKPRGGGTMCGPGARAVQPPDRAAQEGAPARQPAEGGDAR